MNPAREPQPLPGKRVLLVAAQPGLQRATQRQLEAAGLVVHATSSAHEALALIDGGEFFDAAVIDRRLPEPGGIGLARAIRGRPGRLTPPLVLLESIGDKAGDEREWFAARLAKPVRPAILRATVQRAIFPDAVTSAALPPPKTNGVAAAPAGSGAPLVLLVDDGIVNRQVGLTMLRKLGLGAETAVNGCEAVERWKTGHHAVVFMDLQMPEMDGFEATRRIREASRQCDTRPWIVALTANALTEDRDQCAAAGMDDFVAKPIRLEDLREALARVPAPSAG